MINEVVEYNSNFFDQSTYLKNYNVFNLEVSIAKLGFLVFIYYFYNYVNNFNLEVKQKQLNLINKFFEIKKENKLDNYEIVSSFIKDCYKVTELGKGKGKRKYTLHEALEKTKDWLNVT